MSAGGDPGGPGAHGGPVLPAATQVVVAGGGPVGLAAAVELGLRGIECVVVEPRERVSRARPRCKTINIRTMEHLRRWGLADRLRERAPLPVSFSRDIVFCTSLTGRELSRFHGVLGLADDPGRYPETGQQAPQYVLEELLREVVAELPACTFVTGARVADLEQDADEVRVTVQAGTCTGTVVARYVLGCDGPRSIVRDRIGSAYEGGQALRPNYGMVFRAPGLAERVRHGPAVQYWTVSPVAPAMLGPLEPDDDLWWIVAFGVERERGDRVAADLVDGAVGEPVGATILSRDPWTARMQLADRLRVGRVFLAGDAAHLNPPFGGHGLNTGIGDAVDLGWKIAAVLDGWGGPALLDSYEAERRPVQDAVIKAATANNAVLAGDLLAEGLDDDGPAGDEARRRTGERIQASKRAEFFALDLVLGTVLADSPIVVPGGRAPAHRDGSVPDRARPGVRLPHSWLPDGRALYDILGTGMTLAAFGPRASDVARLEGAARERGLPLTVLDLAATGLRERYGADLVLVRPDQHVAWCGDGPPHDVRRLIDTVRGAP